MNYLLMMTGFLVDENLCGIKKRFSFTFFVPGKFFFKRRLLKFLDQIGRSHRRVFVIRSSWREVNLSDDKMQSGVVQKKTIKANGYVCIWFRC